MPPKSLSLRDLAEVHKISDSHLSKWQREGVDVYDSRSVVRKIWSLRTKPPEWSSVHSSLVKNDDDDSHDYWKKEKTKEEVERLRLANAKSSGDMFDRVDGETVMVAWTSALNLALAEMKATLPPQLAGMDESSVDEMLDNEFRKLQENLSDLESQLWQKVYDKYRTGIEDPSADEAGGRNRETSAQKEGKPVVQRPRSTGSRTRPKP